MPDSMLAAGMRMAKSLRNTPNTLLPAITLPRCLAPALALAFETAFMSYFLLAAFSAVTNSAKNYWLKRLRVPGWGHSATACSGARKRGMTAKAAQCFKPRRIVIPFLSFLLCRQIIGPEIYT